MPYRIKSSFLFCFIFILHSAYSQIPTRPVSKEDSLKAYKLSDIAIKFYKNGDFLSAKKQLDSAININSKDSYIYYLRGLALYRLKRHDVSKNDFDKAILLNPKKCGYYIDRASLLISMKEYKAAQEDLLKAKSIDSLRLGIYKNLGKIYKEQGDYKQALLCFSKELRLHGNDPSLYWFRAETYYQLNKDSLAFADIEKGISLKPIDIDIYYASAIKIALKLNEFQSVVKYANLYLQLKPNDYNTQIALAEAYYYTGKYQEAISTANTTESQPNFKDAKENYKVYYFRAAAKLELKDYIGADKDARTGIKLTPPNNKNELADHHLILMETHSRFGKDKEALIDAKAVIESYPDMSAPYGIIGYIELGNKNFHNAIVNLSKAIEFSPDVAVYYVWRGDAENALKQYANSKEDLSKAFSMPNNTLKDKTFVGLALVYEHENNYETALSYATQGIKEFPKCTDLYSVRARIYYVMNDKEAACRDLKAAKELGGKEEANEYAKFCK